MGREAGAKVTRCERVHPETVYRVTVRLASAAYTSLNTAARDMPLGAPKESSMYYLPPIYYAPPVVYYNPWLLPPAPLAPPLASPVFFY